MREIKFRAWNKYGMTDPFTLMQCGEFDTPQKGTVKWPDPTEFMQFTGLKDKNGKEIYEGDLVLRTKSIITDSRPYEVFFAEVRCSFALTRKEKNFNSYDDIVKCKWSENDKYHIVCPDGDRDESLEVIGNIYEHPELLK